MRKIIILPSFASSHLLKCSIPNWIDVIEPDIIIINSGLFPQGPENKGHIDNEFRKKWCHPEIDYVGFDYDETYEFCKQFSNVFLFKINHSEKDVNLAFLDSISKGLESFSIQPSDIIFPLEPDVLFHENDKEKINDHLKWLTPGDGISCKWIDFLETQFYTESINVQFPKFRRFAYCFDTMENYKNAMNAFMTQDYKSLRKVTDFIGFHYCWFQPEPWKQLRFELIYRSDPQYWKDFERGLREIRNWSENQFQLDGKRPMADKILIRPSRQDEGRWAKFIDISHPRHIQSHENWVK